MLPAGSKGPEGPSWEVGGLLLGAAAWCRGRQQPLGGGLPHAVEGVPGGVCRRG